MRALLLIFLLTIISCQTHQKQNEVSNSNNKGSTKLKLPLFAQNYLIDKLPSWQLASKENWGDTLFRRYQTDSSQMNYVVADFNCDHTPDFAAILKDSTGNFAAFKIISFDQYYLHHKLEDFGVAKQLDFGIRYLNPGSAYQRYDESLQIFDCGAIEIFFTNSNSKRIFYSDKKGASFSIQKAE